MNLNHRSILADAQDEKHKAPRLFASHKDAACLRVNSVLPKLNPSRPLLVVLALIASTGSEDQNSPVKDYPYSSYQLGSTRRPSISYNLTNAWRTSSREVTEIRHTAVHFAVPVPLREHLLLRLGASTITRQTYQVDHSWCCFWQLTQMTDEPFSRHDRYAPSRAHISASALVDHYLIQFPG